MINLSEIKTIAVVGATNNSEKYGYKIVENLKRKGFNVWPVNPKEKEILSLKVYSSLQDLPQEPELVVLVVPATIGLIIINQMHELGWQNVWVQPGAESEKLIAELDRLKFNYIVQACIMMN